MKTTSNTPSSTHQAKHPAPHQAPPSPPTTAAPNKSPKPRKKPHASWRHNGNVARLPKATRDKINLMIQDGLSYPDILKELGDQAKGLNVVNLSRWKNGGYQDWLIEQAFIARIRARQETPSELVRDCDGTDVSHAALQLGTLHIFEALRELGPGTLNEKLGGDCAAFTRLVHALARASRETMLVQKYREACALARAALQPMRDPRRKLTDEERHAIVRHVDELLGLDQDISDGEQSPVTGIIRLHPRPGAEAAAAADKGQADQNGEGQPATGGKEGGEPGAPPSSEAADGK